MSNSQRCPICMANIETPTPLEYCPACKEYIGDKVAHSGIGINTASATRGDIATTRNTVL